MQILMYVACGLIERVLPDSQEIFHKASPVSLPGMPVSGGLDSSNRSERSTDSERQSSVKYQVADAGQFRTTSVYSNQWLLFFKAKIKVGLTNR